MSSLFSGKGPQINFTPQGFTAGGLSSDGMGNVTPTADRTAAVGGLSDAGAQAAGTFGNLAQSVAPGFNSLLDARLTDLGNTSRAAIGDLRQNLASRRILGSSFGNDTINRLQTGISQQRDSIIADNFLKSLATSSQLATQQMQAHQQQFQSKLDELNLEAGIGQKVSATANQILDSNAQAQAKLDAGAQAGSGALIGKLIGVAAAPFTGGASLALTAGANSLFGGGSPSGYGA